MDLIAYLRRQIAFSRGTYGPGTRTKGVIDHIRKELIEVEEAQTQEEKVNEWVDIVILGYEGLWRELAYGDAEYILKWRAIPDYMVDFILNKQDKNEQRDWPDWRKNDGTTAIEHVRGGKHD